MGEGGGAGFDRARALRLAAYGLMAAAAALLYLRRPEWAFLVAALAASARFLNVRAGLIRKHDLVKVGRRDWRPRGEVEADEGDEEEEEEEEEGEDEEDEGVETEARGRSEHVGE
jgi:hypothetical protein